MSTSETTTHRTAEVTTLRDDLERLADHVVELVDAAPRTAGGTVEANVRASRTRHGLTRFANSFIHQNVAEDTVSVGFTVDSVSGLTRVTLTLEVS